MGGTFFLIPDATMGSWLALSGNLGCCVRYCLCGYMADYHKFEMEFTTFVRL